MKGFIKNVICRYLVTKEIVFNYENVTDEKIEYWKKNGWY